MHALEAVRRGATVRHLDADPEPRRASVRNFGLIWVSGRAPGAELDLAVRARERWEAIGAEVPDVGFRADGSLTVAQDPRELAVLEEAAARPDAGVRGFELLDADATRRRNPALRGKLLGALHCTRDAVVEPRHVLPAVRRHLDASGRYSFAPGSTAIEIGATSVRDHLGEVHEGDLVLVCPGAAHDVLGPASATAPLRRCRLQMLQTEPLPERLTTSVADGDSLRYYPVFRTPAGAALPAPLPIVEEHRAQLLIAQRADGELTIGDTHHYDEPFDFALDERPSDHLLARAESLLGTELPPVRRRWSGVYSQATDERACYRGRTPDGAMVVTGLGGRGMTLSPAVAEVTCEEAGL
jgi:FAD dependent oxidoreductase TIGR03364